MGKNDKTIGSCMCYQCKYYKPKPGFYKLKNDYTAKKKSCEKAERGK